MSLAGRYIFLVGSTLPLTYHFHLYGISASSINGCCHSDFTGINTGSFETHIVQFDCRAIPRELEKNSDMLMSIMTHSVVN